MPRPTDTPAQLDVILPDVLQPGLAVVFCGTAAGKCSAAETASRFRSTKAWRSPLFGAAEYVSRPSLRAQKQVLAEPRYAEVTLTLELNRIIVHRQDAAGGEQLWPDATA